MDLIQYSQALRKHDWTAEMSDTRDARYAAKAELDHLRGFIHLSKNYYRLFLLGTGYHKDFMSTPSRDSAIRWAGAYLWVRGVRLTYEEVEAGYLLPTGHVNWPKVFEATKEGC